MRSRNRPEQITCKIPPIIEKDAKANNHDEIEDRIIAMLSCGKVLRSQPFKVGLEHHHQQDGRHTAHQILKHRHACASQVLHRRQEYERPEHYVQKNFQSPIQHTSDYINSLFTHDE